MGFFSEPNLKNDMVVEGEIKKSPDGKWTNLVPPPTGAQSSYKPRGGAFQQKVVSEAMAVKAENIKEAQDRSAWMWAKNNASTLIAALIQSSDLSTRIAISSERLDEKVIDLATKIYNGEPIEPFSSKPKTQDVEGQYEPRVPSPEDIYGFDETDEPLPSEIPF